MKQKPNQMDRPPYTLVKQRLHLDDIGVDVSRKVSGFKGCYLTFLLLSS